MTKQSVIIYTDGGCRGNGKDVNIGAWATVMMFGEHKKEFSGFERNTTNNQMELMGAIMALENMIRKDIPVAVHVDSAYVLNGVTSWIKGWKKKGWKTADKKPVKNKELWQRLDALAEEFDDLTWVKVKGHNNVEHNERADELVNQCMDENE